MKNTEGVTKKYITKVNIINRFLGVILFAYAYIFVMGPLTEKYNILSQYGIVVFMVLIVLEVILLGYLIYGMIRYFKQT